MSNEIKFVDVDAKKIENELIKSFEDAYGETLYLGDERRIFLMQLLPLIIGLKNSINDTGRQNLLRFARGAVLDELGGNRTVRLPAQRASAEIKFTLSSAQSIIITIPKGTRVTPDGLLYFQTIENLIIHAGQTFGVVKAEAAEAGEQYNNLLPGQIKNLVDPIPYVLCIENIETTSEGANTEDDDAYRDRIRQAPESYSTAGPDGAYEFWAKTANANIADVVITSPTPGIVKIIVLMKDGQLPSQAILDAVNATVSAKNRRPLTDYVQVAAPIEVGYNVELTYYIDQERFTEVSAIKGTIEGSGGSVEQYIKWQSEKLGRAVNPDYLRQLMLQAGACRIDIITPAYTALEKNQVAKLGNLTIKYGGLI